MHYTQCVNGVCFLVGDYLYQCLKVNSNNIPFHSIVSNFCFNFSTNITPHLLFIPHILFISLVLAVVAALWLVVVLYCCGCVAYLIRGLLLLLLSLFCFVAISPFRL